jgi:UDP-N-acetylmuramate: L-alanyl-gamma-D-glutamyl-meso-diaminopimelate ligase
MTMVLFNPNAFQIKKMELLTDDDIHLNFGAQIQCFHSGTSLHEYLEKQDWNNHNLLLMSSGTFDGLVVDF